MTTLSPVPGHGRPQLRRFFVGRVRVEKFFVPGHGGVQVVGHQVNMAEFVNGCSVDLDAFVGRSLDVRKKEARERLEDPIERATSLVKFEALGACNLPPAFHVGSTPADVLQAGVEFRGWLLFNLGEEDQRTIRLLDVSGSVKAHGPRAEHGPVILA